MSILIGKVVYIVRRCAACQKNNKWRHTFHHFDPAATPPFTAGGGGAFSIISFRRNPGEPAGGAMTGIFFFGEAPPHPDPAVGLNSAAGRLHSASTVPAPPAPLLPANLRQKNKEKQFPCCLATDGKPSSGSEGERRGREHAEERKKRRRKKPTLRKDFFFVIYLIKLKDYSALSQLFSFPFYAIQFPSIAINSCFFFPF